MKPITLIVLLLCLAAIVSAVPPIGPSRADITKRSELVAIVTVSNVTSQVVGKPKNQVRQERASASVERVLKGTAPQRLVLAYDEPVTDILCTAPRLSSGRFLVFLRRDGDVFVRTDTWYSQHSIETNHVHWFLERTEPFDAAISQVERIIKSQ
jgi:hypothetical protein